MNREAIEMLRVRAVRAAERGDVEAAAVLLDALLYLTDPLNYERIDLAAIAETTTLDHWIRDVVRGMRVSTIRVYWTDAEMLLVKDLYATTSTAEIARRLKRPVGGVYQAAMELGVYKSREAHAQSCREAMLNPNHGGRRTQFRNGLIPFNKGKKMPGWAPGRMRDTQFRKGQRPHTWRPVGTEVVGKHGHRMRKVSDTGTQVERWRGVHELLWEEAHGPVPAGHALFFKDRNPGNVRLDNLELLTRAELMARNTIHNLPPELVETIMLKGRLNRKLRSLDKAAGEEARAEQQDERSA